VRKSLIIQLLVIAVVIGVVAFVIGFWIPWLPPLASEEGGRIDDLYIVTSAICLVIFAIVASVSLYALVKFRARPDDDEDGKPIHGNTVLELFWTAIPTVLVTAIAVYSAVVLVKNEDLPEGHRTIEVNAVQFAWSFAYPDEGLERVGELYVPVGETIELELTAHDVIHSFWVPEWRVKQDAVPGTLQRVIVTPTKTGKFPIICTELCGIGHSTMRNWVNVVPAEEFDRWLQEMQADGGGDGATDGKAIFAEAGCVGCHTLADEGSTAEVGPNLDMVLPGQSEEAVRESIVDPNAVISEGYQPDVMPPNFGETLSEEQLNALVAYLLEAAGT
jgi:cytochrome c oxidase subunit 2